MTLRAILLLTLAAVGCAAEAPAEEVTSGASSAALEAPVVEAAEADVVAPPPCEVVFTADAAIADQVTAAAARWSQATGCDVHVGEGGIPVRVVARDAADLLNHETGAYQPAVTVMDETGTRIALAPDWEKRNFRAVIHEMGHALSGITGHCDDPTALMYWNPSASSITAADLVYVCARLACTVFQPE